jgi:hypothetical protein
MAYHLCISMDFAEMPPTPQPARAWRADGLDMSRKVWISWPISWDDEWWMNHFYMVNGGLLNGDSTIPPTDLWPLPNPQEESALPTTDSNDFIVSCWLLDSFGTLVCQSWKLDVPNKINTIKLNVSKIFENYEDLDDSKSSPSLISWAMTRNFPHHIYYLRGLVVWAIELPCQCADVHLYLQITMLDCLVDCLMVDLDRYIGSWLVIPPTGGIVRQVEVF